MVGDQYFGGRFGRMVLINSESIFGGRFFGLLSVEIVAGPLRLGFWVRAFAAATPIALVAQTAAHVFAPTRSSGVGLVAGRLVVACFRVDERVQIGRRLRPRSLAILVVIDDWVGRLVDGTAGPERVVAAAIPAESDGVWQWSLHL